MRLSFVIRCLKLPPYVAFDEFSPLLCLLPIFFHYDCPLTNLQGGAEFPRSLTIAAPDRMARSVDNVQGGSGNEQEALDETQERIEGTLRALYVRKNAAG